MSDEIRTNVILMGRYQVQGELGRGGMGSVYLAYDLQHRRPVAIKVARLTGEEARAQFRREALYLQKLHHHSLPRVWDVFSDDQRDFLVMEYIPGDDLESLVQRQGPQPEWLVLRWADELLDVLDYLHTQEPPIIHRDVKPGNLKLRQNDTLVLVDFGIARDYVPEGQRSRGLSAISPGFSPPEQYSDQTTDARTDVYAAGATLYYLLSGQAPAPAPDRQSGVAGVAPVSKIAPKTSQATEKIVTQALELEPGARWNNAAEMRRSAAAASRKLVSAAPLAAPEPPPLIVSPVNSAKKPATSKPAPASASAPAVAPRRTGLALVFGALGVVLLALAAFLWMNSTSPGTATPTAPAASAAQVKGNTAIPTTLAVVAGDTVVTSTPAAGEATATQPAASSGTATPTTPLVTSTLNLTATTVTTSPTATLAPAATRPPTNTPVRTATPIRPPATVAPTATPKPAPMTVTLISPAPAEVIGGVVTFRWQASRPLSGNQAFELAFWKAGQNPLAEAFSPSAATQNNEITVDLNKADVAMGLLFDAGDYLWGVLLVEPPPNYQRLGLASEGRPFHFQPNGGSTPNPG